MFMHMLRIKMAANCSCSTQFRQRQVIWWVSLMIGTVDEILCCSDAEEMEKASSAFD
jgi:hypothetical protein